MYKYYYLGMFKKTDMIGLMKSLPKISILIGISILLLLDPEYSRAFNSNLKFVKYSTGMGLSSDNQRCIVQDNQGFIWIGTGEGLNRFDGRSFKIYRSNPKSNTSLKSNIITCLFCDSNGQLWVGTYGGGLSLYNKEKDNFLTYTSDPNNPKALLSGEINAIAEDKYKKLWIGTNLGLYQYDQKIDGFIRYTMSPDQKPNSRTIAHYSINYMKQDDDILWITYASGVLTAFNTTEMSFKHYKLFDVASHQTADFSVNSLVIDENLIWISTWTKGIWIFDKITGKAHPYEKESSQYINFFFKDKNNRYWYNPEGGGLVLIDDNNRIEFKFNDYDPYSISSNSLSSIYQDRQNNIWITSKQGDLNFAVLNNPFYSWYRNPGSQQGLTKNLINAVIEDSKKRIWIGYDNGGIDILDANGVKPKYFIKGDKSTGLGPGPVMYIFESSDGIVWVGKYLDGLKKYDESTKSFISYNHKDNDSASISGNDVRYIDEDSKGNLWLAIHGGGLDKFSPKSSKFVHYRNDVNNPSTSILRDWTYTSLVDKNNNIWVGTVAGISVVSDHTATVKNYVSNSEEGYNLSNNIAQAVYVDSKENIWVGTTDGLSRIDRKTDTIKKYFVKDGLPSNSITEILEDNHYNLWIGTGKGLSRFSLEKEKFQNFSTLDGLITNNFTASFKSSTGEMYFAGKGGVNRFHPDSIKINYYKPPVYITDFRLFNKPVRIAEDTQTDEFSIPQQITFCKEIELAYHQNVFTIGFVALNYQNLEKNQHKYKLEGFQDDWVSAGYQREVTYTNLSPGKYTFRVIASNNDGIWNTQGAYLNIIVHPPLWRSGWAYAFYSLVALLLLYGFRKLILHEAEIKNRLQVEELEIKKLQEMDTLKMHFFSNISHEFRTPLTLIVGPIDTLLKDIKDESQIIHLNVIKRNANRLLRLINQLMDFRKIEEAKLEMNFDKSDLIHFIKDIFDSFNHEAKERRINYSFIQTCSFLEVWFDHDKLDKIIYNLLSNAFKFTPDGGSIGLSLIVDEASAKYSGVQAKRTIEIIVKDSGIGIPKESQQKIFDRFYQVKNYLTTQGTGIGLSLTYELIRLHYGNIFLESEPNAGSKFTVILPLWTEESELPSASLALRIYKESEPKITKESAPEPITQTGYEEKNELNLPDLLIIEDNPDMRLYITNEFKDIYKVTEAHNGTVGIEKAFEEIPDAIICDVMMPGIDGYEVCRKLKQDEKTSHIPILMLTAKSSEQHTIEGFESGADDYIAKPFSSTILKVRIKSLINSRELLRRKFIKDPFAAIKDFSPSKTDEALLKKAYAIVEKNLSNPDFEVSDFAYEIGMSRTQLYRKISAIAGQTVREFIRIIRLKKAAELLVTSEMNITEIADGVGFGSQSYFTTSFTEYFGINPSKYVEKHMKS
jgi:signal transduction histidine kinase/ligand-binding sensor domain-containing protein/DNA-binding response OmpR family regulator